MSRPGPVSYQHSQQVILPLSPGPAGVPPPIRDHGQRVSGRPQALGALSLWTMLRVTFQRKLPHMGNPPRCL